MKRKIANFVLLSAFACVTVFSTGCGGGGNNNPPDPNRGFDVLVLAARIPTNARVQAAFLNGSGTYGSITSFPAQETGGDGFLTFTGAKVPGTWRFLYGAGFEPSQCLGVDVTDRNVSLGSREELECVPRFYSFTASPNMIDALNPPTTITFTGKGIENLYGTPMLAFYDEFGNVVVSTPANQMLWNNGVIESLVVNVPSNINQAYDGTYTVAVHNVNADGSWEIIGAAPVTIYGNPPPPPPPPDGDGCGQQQQNLQQLPCD